MIEILWVAVMLLIATFVGRICYLIEDTHDIVEKLRDAAPTSLKEKS
jgi:hypothetical protein